MPWSCRGVPSSWYVLQGFLGYEMILEVGKSSCACVVCLKRMDALSDATLVPGM